MPDKPAPDYWHETINGRRARVMLPALPPPDFVPPPPSPPRVPSAPERMSPGISPFPWTPFPWTAPLLRTATAKDREDRSPWAYCPSVGRDPPILGWTLDHEGFPRDPIFMEYWDEVDDASTGG
jgi:hypothetical protein